MKILEKQLGKNSVSFSVDRVAIAQILISGALSHFLPIPDIVKTFLAVPTLVTLPFLLGNLIIPRKLVFRNSFIQNFLLSWIFGLSFITILAIVLESINFLNVYLFTGLLIVLSIIRIVIDNFSKTRKYWELNLSIPQRKSEFINIGLPLLAILIWSIVISSFLLWGSQFPTSFAGDELRFTLGAQKLIDSSLIPQLGPYFPYIPLMQAVLSIIFEAHPISFVWAGIFLMYTVFSFGTYWSVYEISGSRSMSLLAMLFATSAFYSKTINLTRFVPMTWVYILFPFIILSVHRTLSKIKEVNRNIIIRFIAIFPAVILLYYFFSSNLLPSMNYTPTWRAVLLIVLWFFSFISLKVTFSSADSFLFSSFMVGLVFLHQDLAPIFIVLVYLFIFLNLVKKHSLRLFNRVAYIFVASALIGLFFSEYLPIPTKYKIAYFGIESTTKYRILLTSYSPVILFFSALGAILYLIKRRKLSISVLFFVSLLVYFLPASLSIRAMIFLTFFISYFASLGVLSVVKVKPHLKNIIGLILALLIIPSLFLPSISWLNDVKAVSGGGTSTFTPEEYATSMWIRENVHDPVIISDPFTQLIISALSGSQHLGEEMMVGECRRVVREILRTPVAKTAWDSVILLLSQDITTDYSKIAAGDIYQRDVVASMRGNRFDLNLTTKEALIIVTSRSIKWCKNVDLWEPVVTQSYLWANMFPSNDPINQSDSSFMKFNNRAYFQLLYSVNNTIYIFKLRTQSLATYSDSELETNASVIFDDDVGFWKLMEIGNGTRSYELSLDEAEKICGNSSLEINVSSGSYDYVDMCHNWEVSQDWSDKNFLSLYLYGVNDSRIISIYLLTTDWNNFGAFKIVDNWRGWAYLVFPLKNPHQTAGKYDSANVSSLYVANAAGSSPTWFDRMVVDK